MRMTPVLLWVVALSIAGSTGTARCEDPSVPPDITMELERMRALHIDPSLLIPHPPDAEAARYPPVDILPGSTQTFVEPDLAPGQDGECERSGLSICFARAGSYSSWTLQTYAGAWGSATASGQMPTPQFRVPGPAGSRYSATISASASYGGTMIALAGIGGTARTYFTLSASLFRGGQLLQTKAVASEECLARAYGLAGDECGRTFDASGTADFQVSLEANQTYTVVFRGTAFARALLASVAATSLNESEEHGGLYWGQVIVSVEPDVAEVLEQTRQEVAAIHQELTEVQAATGHGLDDHHQIIDQIGTGLAMEDTQIQMISALGDLVRIGQDHTESLLIRTEGMQARAIESSLLRGEPLVGLYLPVAQGGFLESLRDLVAVRIEEASAIGQDTTVARTILGVADEAIVKSAYREAFLLLAQAYQSMTGQVSIPRRAQP